MHCRFSRFRPCVSFTSPDPAASPAVGALDAYTNNRRTHIFLLRRQTRLLVFLFATLEAVWRGPVEIVFSRNFDAAIDHGFVYTAGYILSWVYMCIFGVVYSALFEWWLPTPSKTSSPTLESITSSLNKMNLFLIPCAIGITLAMWAMMVIFTFIGKHNTPLKHTSRVKQVLVLLATTSWTTAFGYFSLEHLAKLGIAHVRWEMDAWVLLPIAINMGLAIGTAAIAKSERKRVNRDEARDAEQAISVEEFLAEEKRPLVEV